MQVRQLVVVVCLTVGLVACGENNLLPTPTATAPAALETSQPAATPTVLAATPRQPPSTPTSVAVSTTTPNTDDVTGDHFIPEQAEEFANHLQDAMYALEELPGYSYTVKVPGTAPGPALTGNVSASGDRNWTVHEADAPDHTVARWVLVSGESYTDISGAWQEVQDVPFDRNAPISFGHEYMNTLFQPYGTTVVKAARVNTELEGRAALRHDLELDYDKYDEEVPGSHTDTQPPELSTRSKTSLWVARDGGYLLQFSRQGLLTAPGGDPLTVNVQPLEAAPRIAAPKIGATAYKGASPPPWRAMVIGLERLRTLESYSFKASHGDLTFGGEASGRISSTQGHITGKVPDFEAIIDHESSDDSPPHMPLVDAELIYTGSKLWARTQGGAWHRASVSGANPSVQWQSAMMLLSFVPGGPPRSLVGDEYLDLMGASGVFGLTGPRMGRSPVLVRSARLVGVEQINGVRALHYRSSSQEGSGDVWLDARGFHLVRLRTDISQPWLFPMESPGSATSEVDVTDANKPFTVKPPSGG